MNTALYVIAILGCGEGEAPCQPVQVIEQRYESREACLAATDGALERASNVDFPVVVAECRAQGAAAAQLRGSDVRLPDPDRRPSAWDQ
ncbi:MAG TPA: hypothetical protein VEZ20_06295 [Allosphingosinicella sp.]|jgi:hypothetical protein|nr:hypothetical protein [Allosphingosinicella sp.]